MPAGKSPQRGDDDEPLEQGEEQETEDQEQAAGEEEAEEEEEAGEEGEAGAEAEEEAEGEGEEEAEGETVVQWADDEPEAGEKGDSKVIRRIRERNKELVRENAELRKAVSMPTEPEPDIGPKPRSVDYNYDDDAYEAALDAWKDKKIRADAAKAAQTAQAEEVNREWQGDLARYEAKKQALAMADYDEVIAPVRTRLSLAQQSVIVKVAQDPAAFSYALGGSPTRLAELEKIQDPFKFGAAIARMEGGVKVTKRRKPTTPDRPAQGSARIAAGRGDKKLEKLEAEAEETGVRTDLIAYKKAQRKAEAAATRR
jgi:hypothetical protein